MDLVIANDSGPIHMAAALGTPVLALFGPSDPARTGPYGPRHVVLRGGEPCEPCYKRECPRESLPVCLGNISVETVLRSALKMIR
jgi:heptosyltransferase I